MRRTTVLLTEETSELLRLEAERRGVTPSEIVREAITVHLTGKPGQAKGFLKLAGAFKGPPPHDVAEGLEDVLSRMTEDVAERNGLARRDR
jgi:hypothetical protein